MVLLVIKTIGWRVRTLDIKTAYLQGREMKREVYVSSKVWHLKKTVYWLKDAARNRCISLMEVLKERNR